MTPQMPAQRRSLRAFEIANAAMVRLFAGMSHQVTLQLESSVARVGADVARKSLHRQMGSLMDLQITRTDTPVGAPVACKRPLFGMSHQFVVFQRRKLYGLIRAHVAREVFDSGVHFLVDRQRTFRFRFEIANVAREPPLYRVFVIFVGP